MKRSQKIWIAMGIAFLIVLTFSTIFSYRLYQLRLPVVQLTVAQTTPSGCVAPINAVQTDSAGHSYILLVKVRHGAWGKEYVCESKYVSVFAVDNSAVQLIGIDSLNYPIVADSNQPVHDGSVVRLNR